MRQKCGPDAPKMLFAKRIWAPRKHFGSFSEAFRKHFGFFSDFWMLFGCFLAAFWPLFGGILGWVRAVFWRAFAGLLGGFSEFLSALLGALRNNKNSPLRAPSFLVIDPRGSARCYSRASAAGSNSSSRSAMLRAVYQNPASAARRLLRFCSFPRHSRFALISSICH